MSECQILIKAQAGQLAIDGERREKCVKLVGVGMSANHDIKSQPPAAHFTTILCTKSQQSRFVALPRQLPHLKKFKREGKGEEPATPYFNSDFVVYCYDGNGPVL